MPYRLRNLPPTVRVGSQTYSIEIIDQERSDENGIWGDCNAVLRRIRLAEHMPDATHAIETLTHELLHACYRAFHIEAERDEEYTVTRLAAAFAAVLVDNPAIRKWIDKAAG